MRDIMSSRATPPDDTLSLWHCQVGTHHLASATDAPSVIFIGCLTLVDCWIGYSVMCAYFYMFKNLEGRDTKLHFLVDIVACRYFDYHSEDSGGECHDGWDLRSSNGGSVIEAMKNLLGVSWLVAVATASRGGSTWGLQSLNFQDKMQGLLLIDCAWQWPSWRHCFESMDFL